MKISFLIIQFCLLIAITLILWGGPALVSNDLHEGTANMTALGCVGCVGGDEHLDCVPRRESTCEANCPSPCDILCSGASGWYCGSGTYDNCEDGTYDCEPAYQKGCQQTGDTCKCVGPSEETDCGKKGWCSAYSS